MVTITIPNKIIKDEELVAIPKREYEKLLHIKIKNSASSNKKDDISIRISKKKGEFYTKLDKGLKEALEDVRAGRMFGPFDNAKDLIMSLKTHKNIK